ncbi:D-alanyl-D-alanine carboxypeptidase [Acidithiobacillus sp. HP-6]|uniref:D-alanyl-D-alanine carboxypeptidase family protein n=1 Tax=unclassified Acidithiobacillus TaxID=2614800 RepID=UPI0018792892|nr:MULTISPECIES: D-alanyl-D-alanine carboxypeptidase family protein [unclassified Acidithiobacillus]MBE7563420.1 D-alanyl-D-alanine carboxypeptidase [Acidithiobacillus sp. HP-6]MBE7569633.1 D-alanyl-D-alanine carboxypeptidase [Acidithiobacillus sp. HP-2]
MIFRPSLMSKVFLVFFGLLFASTAFAVVPTPRLPTPPAPALPSIVSYVLMDYDTGQIIAAKSENLRRAPASLTKLMTAYLTYQAIHNGTLNLNENIQISNTAWKTGGSSMFIQPGLAVNIDQLLHGLLIDSGNDAAVALAETVAGSQSGFVTLMNETAAQLGLHDTHYNNVDGLPDDNLYTTALDVAQLSRTLIQQYPQVIQITKQKSYTYNKITQRSWNPVLFRDPSVDGLKTGLTDASGYCIDATAQRSGRRLIAVVMGGPNWAGSTNAVEALLDYGYRFFVNHPVYQSGQQVGKITRNDFSPMHVPVGVTQKVTVTVPKGHFSDLQRVVEINPNLQLPLKKGTVVGALVFQLDGKTLKTVPVVSMVSAEKAGWLSRMFHKIGDAL